MGLNLINSILCYPARKNNWLFFLSIQICYFVNAGVYTIFPLPVVKTFGSKHGPRVYAFVMFSNAAIAVVNLILVSIKENGSVPVEALFVICATASLISFSICWRFDEKISSKEMDKMEKKGEIVFE